MYALLLLIFVSFVLGGLILLTENNDLTFFFQKPDTNNDVIILKTPLPTVSPTVSQVYTIGYCQKFPQSQSLWFLNNYREISINKKTPVRILDKLDIMMMPRKEQKACWNLPVFVKLQQLKKENKRRPLMLYIAGEVFSAPSRRPYTYYDAALYRSLEEQPQGCANIHYLQTVQLANKFGKTNKMLTHKVSTKAQSKFCAFITKSIFLRTHYKQPDALIRHAMFQLISEYKKCERPKCRGGFWDTKECYKDYKFAITMENTAEKGYVTEKLFSGIMGDTMPIYFGAPDIAKYVNTKRFVHCQIPPDVLAEFRTFYRRPNFFFDGHNPKKQPSDEALVKWATNYWRDHLKPCVEEVLFLDKNNTAYEEKRREDFYLSNKEYYFKGGYEREQMEQIIKNLY